MDSQRAKIVFGAAGLGFNPDTINIMGEIFDLLEIGGCTTLDTAAMYGASEERLGALKAGARFTLDTKTKGGLGGPGYATKENIITEANRSRELLGGTVDVFYLHGPDPETPLENTLEGVNEVYKTGFFKRFGLSNFSPDEVVKIHSMCTEKGYPLPQVYQGNYNAFARKQETVLFPTLRKLNIAFYAYSPIAGGFLSKSKNEIQTGSGRFQNGGGDLVAQMYTKLYGKASLIDALDQWELIANDEGISKAELAYRWVIYNSILDNKHGDSVVIGSRDTAQVKQTMAWVNNGPLSAAASQRIDGIWTLIEHESPLDNIRG